MAKSTESDVSQEIVRLRGQIEDLANAMREISAKMDGRDAPQPRAGQDTPGPSADEILSKASQDDTLTELLEEVRSINKSLQELGDRMVR